MDMVFGKFASAKTKTADPVCESLYIIKLNNILYCGTSQTCRLYSVSCHLRWERKQMRFTFWIFWGDKFPKLIYPWLLRSMLHSARGKYWYEYSVNVLVIWVSCSVSLNLRSLICKKEFNRNIHRPTVTVPNTQ